MFDKKFISDKFETPAFHSVLRAMDLITNYIKDRQAAWNVYIAAPFAFIQKLENEMETAFGVKRGTPLHKLSPFRRTQFVPGYEPKLVIFHFDYPKTLNHSGKIEFSLPEDWHSVACKPKKLQKPVD